MQKSKIEWLRNPMTGQQGFTINPVKGLCPMHCKTPDGYEYCYAAGERGLYKRFKWNPEIRLVPLFDVHVPEGSRIFVGSTFELFGDWVRPEWLIYIFRWVRVHPQHTFIFLTKCPQNLRRWSPFPKNCWIGTTITGKDIEARAVWMCDTDFKAKVKFASFEPLLSQPQPSYLKRYMYLFDWLILGSQTQPIKHPSREWVDEIISAADKAQIPVFVKSPMAEYFHINRREIPNEKN